MLCQLCFITLWLFLDVPHWRNKKRYKCIENASEDEGCQPFFLGWPSHIQFYFATFFFSLLKKKKGKNKQTKDIFFLLIDCGSLKFRVTRGQHMKLLYPSMLGHSNCSCPTGNWYQTFSQVVPFLFHHTHQEVGIPPASPPYITHYIFQCYCSIFGNL